MKKFASLLIFAGAMSAAISVEASDCLEVALTAKRDKLSLAAGGASAAPDRSAKAISRDFRTVYETLEKNTRLSAITPVLERLSSELIAPVAAQLRSASCVVFVIPPESMHFALDLLTLDGKPLFIQKPVGFAFVRGVDFKRQPVTPSSKGLIIRDPDTDPEDGARSAHSLYPASRLLFMNQAKPRTVEQARADFILISGHGSVTMPWDSSEDDDSVGFGDDEMTASELRKSRHKLVYLDSCQIGMSKDLIEASRRAGGQFFLAPIISNEAGNSSTRTIRYFFGALREGQTPMRALFAARQKLYNDFNGRVSAEKLLYYSYPFRIYGFP